MSDYIAPIVTMAQRRPLDAVSILPDPVLEMVLVQVDDLASLYSIYRSSPAVFYLLREDGTARRIIQRIMELSVPKQTQVLIRKFISCDRMLVLLKMWMNSLKNTSRMTLVSSSLAKFQYPFSATLLLLPQLSAT